MSTLKSGDFVKVKSVGAPMGWAPSMDLAIGNTFIVDTPELTVIGNAYYLKLLNGGNPSAEIAAGIRSSVLNKRLWFRSEWLEKVENRMEETVEKAVEKFQVGDHVWVRNGIDTPTWIPGMTKFAGKFDKIKEIKEINSDLVLLERGEGFVFSTKALRKVDFKVGDLVTVFEPKDRYEGVPFRDSAKRYLDNKTHKITGKCEGAEYCYTLDGNKYDHICASWLRKASDKMAVSLTFEAGDYVLVKKPADFTGSPYWNPPVMDRFDGKEFRLDKKSEYVKNAWHLVDGGEFHFSENWFTKLDPKNVKVEPVKVEPVKLEFTKNIGDVFECEFTEARSGWGAFAKKGDPYKTSYHDMAVGDKLTLIYSKPPCHSSHSFSYWAKAPDGLYFQFGQIVPSALKLVKIIPAAEAAKFAALFEDGTKAAEKPGEKIVEKIVEKPVEKVVEKIVEKVVDRTIEYTDKKTFKALRCHDHNGIHFCYGGHLKLRLMKAKKDIAGGTDTVWDWVMTKEDYPSAKMDNYVMSIGIKTPVLAGFEILEEKPVEKILETIRVKTKRAVPCSFYAVPSKGLTYWSKDLSKDQIYTLERVLNDPDYIDAKLGSAGSSYWRLMLDGRKACWSDPAIFDGWEVINENGAVLKSVRAKARMDMESACFASATGTYFSTLKAIKKGGIHTFEYVQADMEYSKDPSQKYWRLTIDGRKAAWADPVACADQWEILPDNGRVLETVKVKAKKDQSIYCFSMGSIGKGNYQVPTYKSVFKDQIYTFELVEDDIDYQIGKFWRIMIDGRKATAINPRENRETWDVLNDKGEVMGAFASGDKVDFAKVAAETIISAVKDGVKAGATGAIEVAVVKEAEKVAAGPQPEDLKVPDSKLSEEDKMLERVHARILAIEEARAKTVSDDFLARQLADERSSEWNKAFEARKAAEYKAVQERKTAEKLAKIEERKRYEAAKAEERRLKDVRKQEQVRIAREDKLRDKQDSHKEVLRRENRKDSIYNAALKRKDDLVRESENRKDIRTNNTRGYDERVANAKRNHEINKINLANTEKASYRKDKIQKSQNFWNALTKDRGAEAPITYLAMYGAAMGISLIAAAATTICYLSYVGAWR